MLEVYLFKLSYRPILCNLAAPKIELFSKIKLTSQGMPKLTSISLKNVRNFNKQTHFDIKPLTMFCGPNSSGKSTVIRSLLLFNESRVRTKPIDRIGYVPDKTR